MVDVSDFSIKDSKFDTKKMRAMQIASKNAHRPAVLTNVSTIFINFDFNVSQSWNLLNISCVLAMG